MQEKKQAKVARSKLKRLRPISLVSIPIESPCGEISNPEDSGLGIKSRRIDLKLSRRKRQLVEETKTNLEGAVIALQAAIVVQSRSSVGKPKRQSRNENRSSDAKSVQVHLQASITPSGTISAGANVPYMTCPRGKCQKAESREYCIVEKEAADHRRSMKSSDNTSSGRNNAPQVQNVLLLHKHTSGADELLPMRIKDHNANQSLQDYVRERHSKTNAVNEEASTLHRVFAQEDSKHFSCPKNKTSSGSNEVVADTMIWNKANQEQKKEDLNTVSINIPSAADSTSGKAKHSKKQPLRSKNMFKHDKFDLPTSKAMLACSGQSLFNGLHRGRTSFDEDSMAAHRLHSNGKLKILKAQQTELAKCKELCTLDVAGTSGRIIDSHQSSSFNADALCLEPWFEFFVEEENGINLFVDLSSADPMNWLLERTLDIMPPQESAHGCQSQCITDSSGHDHFTISDISRYGLSMTKVRESDASSTSWNTAYEGGFTKSQTDTLDQYVHASRFMDSNLVCNLREVAPSGDFQGNLSCSQDASDPSASWTVVGKPACALDVLKKDVLGLKVPLAMHSRQSSLSISNTQSKQIFLKGHADTQAVQGFRNSMNNCLQRNSQGKCVEKSLDRETVEHSFVEHGIPILQPSTDTDNIPFLKNLRSAKKLARALENEKIGNSFG